NELFISSKFPGRIKEVLVNEGDTVTPGQVVARLDTEELEANLRQAEAQIAEARETQRAAAADIGTKRAQVNMRSAQIDAKQADQIRAQIKDAVLVAPMRGRVERRLAEAGEVVPAGGRVYSLVDLSDVYMYIFLPEKVTGKLQMGSEARIVLDAAPQYPIRAT